MSIDVAKRRSLPNVHIRWMISRDMVEVQAIEEEVFDYPWDEDTFIRCLRQKNHIGYVAEHDEQVIGYLIQELGVKRLSILTLAVHPKVHRSGIGQQMVNKLIGKLSPTRRSKIRTLVRETNLPAQLFFKAMGFKATNTLTGHYRDHGRDEDAYEFEYRYLGT